MKWFYNLKIGVRLLIVFGFLALVIAFMGVYSVYTLSVVDNESNDINDQWLPNLNHANYADTIISDFRILEYEHILSQSKQDSERTEQQLESKINEVATEFKSYSNGTMGTDEKKLYDTVVEQWNKYLQIHKDVIIPLSRQLKKDEAMRVMHGDSLAAFNNVSASLLDLVKFNKQKADESDKQGNDVYSTSRSVMILITIVSFIIAIAASLLIIFSITRPVRLLTL
ncbi:MAG TPA: MCP four helix bundle domain-containing protein, partial [Clostridia bacterium]